MSSQILHRTPRGRCWRTTAWKQQGLENLEIFEPVAQEYDGDEFLQQSTSIMSENRIFRARKANASTRHRLLLDQQEKEQRRAQARTETGAQHNCSGSEDLRRKKTDRWGAQLTSVKYWPRPVRGLGDRLRKNEGVTGNRPTQQIDAQSITNGKMNSTDEWSSGLRKRRAEFTSWDSGTGNWVRVGSIPAMGSKARKEKLRLKKNRAPKSMKNEAGNGGTSRPCADETETRHGENLSARTKALGADQHLSRKITCGTKILGPGTKIELRPNRPATDEKPKLEQVKRRTKVSDPATSKNSQHNWDPKEQFFYWT
jgi:hypothetical protein